MRGCQLKEPSKKIDSNSPKSGQLARGFTAHGFKTKGFFSARTASGRIRAFPLLAGDPAKMRLSS
jgi:hypothetical protein